MIVLCGIQASGKSSFAGTLSDFQREMRYYVQTTVDDDVARNPTRAEQTRVPEIAIRSTSRKLEISSLGERWDRLVTVSIAATGGFETKEEP